MNKYLGTLAVAGMLLTTPLVTQANSEHALRDQINYYEYSITQSSVSPSLSEARKTEKLQLLHDARQQVDLGHYRTAAGILSKVAQNLYTLSPKGTGAGPSQDRIEAIMSAIASILPQAQKIALQKQFDQASLHQVMEDYQRAKAALEANDRTTASQLLESSYRVLKENVATLRSGDRLLIQLPAADSREGWMDAAHRYLDWRYFNRQLLSSMREDGINTSVIDQANLDADQAYDLATNIALQGDWKQAVATVDQAYRILENAWRDVGVDVGI